MAGGMGFSALHDEQSGDPQNPAFAFNTGAPLVRARSPRGFRTGVEISEANPQTGRASQTAAPRANASSSQRRESRNLHLMVPMQRCLRRFRRPWHDDCPPGVTEPHASPETKSRPWRALDLSCFKRKTVQTADLILGGCTRWPDISFQLPEVSCCRRCWRFRTGGHRTPKA